MKKVLLIADKQSHIAQFYKPLTKLLHAHDYEVHVAASNDLKDRKDINLKLSIRCLMYHLEILYYVRKIERQKRFLRK